MDDLHMAGAVGSTPGHRHRVAGHARVRPIPISILSWHGVIDSLVVCALLLFILGAAFVSTVNKSYDWWREQSLKSVLKEIEARTTTPERRLDDLLKEYESRVALNLSESLKRQSASSPTFQVTVTEAAKLVLEVIVFQSSPHNEVERETFQRSWQAKLEKFSERIAQEDPLAVEVVLKAIEKESRGAGS